MKSNTVNATEAKELIAQGYTLRSSTQPITTPANGSFWGASDTGKTATAYWLETSPEAVKKLGYWRSYRITKAQVAKLNR